MLLSFKSLIIPFISNIDFDCKELMKVFGELVLKLQIVNTKATNSDRKQLIEIKPGCKLDEVMTVQWQHERSLISIEGYKTLLNIILIDSGNISCFKRPGPV